MPEKKATHRDSRSDVNKFQQIINVGPATERDFRTLGINAPADLIGRDPYQLYVDLCRSNRRVYDACVLDVFMAAVDYMNGNPPKKWWDYTSTRKSKYGTKINKLKSTSFAD